MKKRESGDRKTASKPTAKGGFARSTAVGLFAGIICLMLLSLLCAWIIARFTVPVTAVDGFAVGVVLISGFVGGFFAGLSFGQRGLLLGIICGGMFVLLFLIGNMAWHELQLDSLTCVKLCGVFITAMIGGFLGAKGTERKKKHRYSY